MTVLELIRRRDALASLRGYDALSYDKVSASPTLGRATNSLGSKLRGAPTKVVPTVTIRTTGKTWLASLPSPTYVHRPHCDRVRDGRCTCLSLFIVALPDGSLSRTLSYQQALDLSEETGGELLPA